MEIKEIKDNKKEYMGILLEADPEVEVIEAYLLKGDMFGIFEGDKIVCEVVVTEVDNDTCELKNLATVEEERGKGYATKIIKHIFEIYKDQYKRMIVGTAEEAIPFYVLNGFTKYHHTVKNFFIDNYKEEIWDGDFQCIDMYYYSKEF